MAWGLDPGKTRGASMQDLRGKVAFITGGASGIGFSMAEAFGAEGMAVMLADIEAEALERAVEDLRSRQIRAEGVVADVASRASIKAAAEATIAAFGKVHVVCNNAGVGAGGPFGSFPPGDWDWVIDVNLKGVVYGMEVFEPLIAAHGEGGHFVNTASLAGMVSPPGMEPYCATKFAVVAMSEGWAQQLAPPQPAVRLRPRRTRPAARRRAAVTGALRHPGGPGRPPRGRGDQGERTLHHHPPRLESRRRRPVRAHPGRLRRRRS
jgi:NAD(P)-dependent dehydrogenase (short-subunit alcohol dehydrogenase family)